MKKRPWWRYSRPRNPEAGLPEPLDHRLERVLGRVVEVRQEEVVCDTYQPTFTYVRRVGFPLAAFLSRQPKVGQCIRFYRKWVNGQIYMRGEWRTARQIKQEEKAAEKGGGGWKGVIAQARKEVKKKSAAY